MVISQVEVVPLVPGNRADIWDVLDVSFHLHRGYFPVYSHSMSYIIDCIVHFWAPEENQRSLVAIEPDFFYKHYTYQIIS